MLSDKLDLSDELGKFPLFLGLRPRTMMALVKELQSDFIVGTTSIMNCGKIKDSGRQSLQIAYDYAILNLNNWRPFFEYCVI